MAELLPQEVPLGPFDLVELLGRGGMAVVYRGRHREQGLEVAVKVLTSERAREPRWVSQFENEVRAVARLRHPGIVGVLDVGTVDRVGEELLLGEVVAGSPYYAMEVIEGGTLDPLAGRLKWGRLKATLLGVLDALAHAHARGVIHRDLKPSNILLADEPGRRWPQARVVDFGIAFVGRDSDARDGRGDRITGTPRYMAPEQATGAVRDQGPWTDLYALGCIAHRLATGEPPFDGPNTYAVMRAHLQQPVPELEPNMRVPDGFDAWVRRLLQKSAWDRYRHAADAAWALSRLDDFDEPEFVDNPTHTVVVDGFEPDDEPTIIRLHTEDLEPSDTELFEADEWVARDTALSGRQPDRLAPMERPPLPRHWRRERLPDPPPRLVGAGLNLFHLRPVPMLDRERERTTIWDGLRDVVSSRRARAIVLQGTAGTGKSRVAEWMSQRAAEVGAATIIKVSHSPLGGPGDGVGPALAGHLAIDGLQKADALERLRDWLAVFGEVGPTELHAATGLCEMLRPTNRHFFQSREDRFLVARRFLERMARERPVLLWFDDLQWSADSLRLARFLLERASGLQLLIVATVQTDATDVDDDTGVGLRDFVDREDVTAVGVGPLDAAIQRVLVRGMLGLDERVVDDVVERTGGNPLFAVQLVGDWVERGLLVVGDSGFELRAGAAIEVPDDLHHVWMGRIEQAIGRHADAWSALEIAAALGLSVDAAEWEDACSTTAVTIDDEQIAELFNASLLVASRDGWSFTHNMLRESLLRRAREGDRLSDIHRNCAAVIARRTGLATIDDKERHARHLLQAGDDDVAAESLLAAVEQCGEFGEHHRALSLLDLYDQALDRLQVATDSIRRLRGWIERGWAANQTGRVEEATRHAANCRDLAERLGGAQQLGDAYRLVGTVTRGDSMEDALEAYLLAEQYYGAAGDEHGLGRTLMSLAWANCRLGNFEEALDRISAAVDVFVDLGDPLWESRVRQVRSFVHIQREEYDDAERELQVALAITERTGNAYDGACCRIDIGELLRHQHLVEEARPYYEEALEAFDALGAQMAHVTRLNLGLTALELGDVDEATNVFRQLRRHAETLKRIGLWGQELLGLACCEAHAGRWDVFDDLIAQAHIHADPDAIVDRDLFVTAEWAGTLAAEAGREDSARRAWELALAQAEAMGRDDDVDRITVRLRS